MIELDIKYSGTGRDGKPCFIILHNQTFDLCVPGYKGGGVKTLDYSAIKHVSAMGDDLVLKVMRTEVVLLGIGAENADGLAQVIEIGRNKPIEGSKEFRKYQKAAEKAEARADRKQVRVEKFAAVIDGINRYREQSNQEEREEQERQEREERELEQRIDALGDEIDRQAIKPSDSEEEALAKVLKLNRLFTKCTSKVDYSDQVALVMRVCEDNLSVLQVSHPNSNVTAKAEQQLQQFILDRKESKKAARISCLLTILGIIAFIVLCYFMDDIFPKE
ncbi:MAG: hypothetical protein K2K82_08525 [Muribaculaceae bacterium]|nr:hypothetical protein [Muribaculaceae bacterium]